MIDLLKYRYVYFLISALIILPGLVFIGLGGLKPGIDFTGGTELTVQMPSRVHPTVAAVDAGFSRAWPSIRDSNISTMITCAILWWFGSTFAASIIVGFATTLFIGVAISMLTAVVVSRTFLRLVLAGTGMTNRALFGAGV